MSRIICKLHIPRGAAKPGPEGAVESMSLLEKKIERRINVTCWVEMCHAALNCAVLHCVVGQVAFGIRIMTKLIWVLNSSCLGA